MRPADSREAGRHVMDDAKRVVEGIRKCFKNVSDPRVPGRCDHFLAGGLPALHLLTACNCQNALTLGGADGLAILPPDGLRRSHRLLARRNPIQLRASVTSTNGT